MPFCPRCRFEYRVGVRRCPDCGAALVARLPAEPSLPPAPDLEAVALVRATRLLSTISGESHARLLQDALQERGVVSRLEAAPAPPLILWIPATIRAARHPLFDIYVCPEDLERARQIHADFEASAQPDGKPSAPPEPRPRRPRRSRW